MGGKAIGNTVRLDTESLNSLIERVKEIIKWDIHFVQSYRNKETHGDLDIVYRSSDDHIISRLIEELNVSKIVRNGPVTSIGVELEEGIFQVDLIRVPDESFEFSCNYFDWNDLSNLIGRMAHQCGFKFGHLGMFYCFYDDQNETQKVAEIPVTLNFKDAIEFLGFNYNRYRKGFNSLEEMFEFVANSKFFTVEPYPLEHRSNAARVRDRKRPTYNAFLRWIRDNNIQSKMDWSDRENIRKKFLKEAEIEFPFFSNLLFEQRIKHYRNKMIKSKFNGDLAREWSKLDGKELGSIMSKFKEIYDEDWFIISSHEQIKDEFIKFLENNQ